nr:carbonic anhydrase family protein [Buttiauxella izardii]
MFPLKWPSGHFSKRCSEGVRWLVMKHPVTLSEQQLKQFTSVMHHDNNRPVQPLHGRVVVE